MIVECILCIRVAESVTNILGAELKDAVLDVDADRGRAGEGKGLEGVHGVEDGLDFGKGMKEQGNGRNWRLDGGGGWLECGDE